MRLIALAAACLFAAFAFSSLATAQLPPDLKNSALGPGVGTARFMEFSGDGKTLFLSQGRKNGSVLALRNPDADGVYRDVTVFVKGDRSAQGMSWHDGWL